MRFAFYLSRNALLAVWNFDPQANLQSRGMILMGIFIYVLLFSPICIFHFKVSALNWSHLFHIVRNVWKWNTSPHQCTCKILWKMLVFIFFVRLMFFKEPMRIRAPVCFRKTVRLSARNFCIKPCFFIYLLKMYLKSQKGLQK